MAERHQSGFALGRCAVTLDAGGDHGFVLSAKPGPQTGLRLRAVIIGGDLLSDIADPVPRPAALRAGDRLAPRLPESQEPR